MTRRGLLKRLGLWTAAAGVMQGTGGCLPRHAEPEGGRLVNAAPSAVQASSSSAGEKPGSSGILIIGAGMAGLVAAAELKKQGKDVLVLEGRTRIGGRVHTLRGWEGLNVDLGASWIHGIKGNPVYALAEKLGVTMIQTDYDSATVFSPSGALVSDPAQQRQDALFKQVMHELEALRARREESDAPDISLAQGVAQVALSLELSGDARVELRHTLHTRIEHEYAGTLDSLSLTHFDAEPETEGQDVLFPQGMGALIDFLAQGLDIRLGQTVRKIVEEPGGVRVETQGGAVFYGQSVLVTVPLGVLKSGKLQFEPALEPRRLRAIERLGMGTMDKLYLRFPRPFWMETAPEQFIERMGKEGQGWSETLNLMAVMKAPVLLMFNAGQEARLRSGWSTEALVKDAVAALSRDFGGKIPSPIGSARTSWETDPHALGSYSFYGVGAIPEDREWLGRSRGRIHFAGEAASVRAPGTVTGAYLTGFAAAQRLAHLDK